MSTASRTIQGSQNLRSAALAAVVVAAAGLVGLAAVAGSRTATSQQAVDVAGPSFAAVHDAGIPYVGTGPAAQIIRDSFSVGTEAVVVRGTSGGVGSTGIPYEGTGSAAQIIRDSLALP